MKRIGLVTDVPFWQIGLGKNARVRELFRFLAQQSRLTLYYMGEETSPFAGPIFEEKNKQDQLAAHLQKAKHDLVIAQYVHFDWVADLPLGETEIYLDAIDLLSERGKAFASFQREGYFPSFEEELSGFRKFDKVIFLQKEERDKMIPFLGKERLLLCPHPVVAEEVIPLREKVEVISFFGGPGFPNLDGVQWFHDKVLPRLENLRDKCVLHGTINTSPLTVFFPGLSKGKCFSSLIEHYRGVDIAINPMLYGSGLKIKTVEALAYGIPLVTTSVGAQGLQEEQGRSFLLADTGEAFAEAICELASSFELRQTLSAHARTYAKRHLTPEVCFSSLLK